jgi:hypothetical protein
VAIENLFGLADRFVRELGKVVDAFGQRSHRLRANERRIPLDAASALIF